MRTQEYKHPRLTLGRRVRRDWFCMGEGRGNLGNEDFELVYKERLEERTGRRTF